MLAMDQDRYRVLLDDLRAESEELLTTLFDMPDPQWSLRTPSAGWDVHDQVVHLAYFDDMALLAMTQPDKFQIKADGAVAVGPDWVDEISHSRRALPPSEVLAGFAQARSALLEALIRVGPATRAPWFGPPMSAASCATARLMETWAHGQDLYDALGLARMPGQRIRHICHLGVLTRRYSYEIHGLTMPEVDIRVELVAPDGQMWTWGADESAARITGDAWDFALVVTQRRHLTDTNLLATPGPAAKWLSIAQAFAGGLGAGRPATSPAPPAS